MDCPPALLVTTRVLELQALAMAGDKDARERLAELAALLEGCSHA